MDELKEKDFELSDKLSQSINDIIAIFIKDIDDENTGRIVNLALAKILSWNAYYFVDEGTPEYALRDIDEIAELAKTITLGIMENEDKCSDCAHNCNEEEDNSTLPETLN